MNRDRVNQLLPAASRILVVGEMILDEFIWGKVSRISPEAPVPVLEVVRETFNAGGAAVLARLPQRRLAHVTRLVDVCSSLEKQ